MSENHPEHSSQTLKILLSPLGQALLLGATGFFAGYFFPLWRTPYASAGPLLGIFFAGPLGFIAGLATGLLVKSLHVRLVVAGPILIVLCLSMTAWVYIICEPEDRWESELVYGSVENCTPPSQLQPEVLTTWEESIKINPQKTVLPTWREDVAMTLKQSSVQVANVRVLGKRPIFIGRHANNEGLRYAGDWIVERGSSRYFVSKNLCGHDSNNAVVYLSRWPEWPRHERFPPDDASRLLNLPHLSVPPQEYQAWASR